VMPMRAPAVRWAGFIIPTPDTPSPTPEFRASIIAQSIVDGSLRTPGLRLVFINVCSGEFTIILWCGVEEPADSVGIVVDGDGGSVGATVGVVAGDGAFG
jgi:hypothetical protein